MQVHRELPSQTADEAFRQPGDSESSRRSARPATSRARALRADERRGRSGDRVVEAGGDDRTTGSPATDRGRSSRTIGRKSIVHGGAGDRWRSRSGAAPRDLRRRSTRSRSGLRIAPSAGPAPARRCRRSSGRRRAPAVTLTSGATSLPHSHDLAPGRSRNKRNASSGALAIEGIVEQRQGNAPGMANRRVAAGQAQSAANVATRSNAVVACDQNFAAPGRAVGAVAGAVVGNADHRVRSGRAPPWRWRRARDDAARRSHALGSSQRVSGRKIVGMQIVGDDFRRGRRGIAPFARSTLRKRRRSRHSRDRQCAARDTPSRRRPMQKVFFSSAPHASTGASKRVRHLDRARHVAARAPQDHWPPRDDASDRVVAAALRCRGRATETGRRCRPAAATPRSFRKAIGSSRRLPGSHHHRSTDVAQQQMVERRVGENQPDQRIARRDVGRQCTSVAAADQHDRPFDRRSAARLLLRSAGESLARRRRSRTITANGFASRRLRHRKRATTSRDGRIAGKVKAAKSLDRDDLAEPQGARAAAAIGFRLSRRFPLPSPAPAPGRSRGRRSAARGSADPRRRRTRPAGRAHREPRHRRRVRSYGVSRAIVKRGPQFVQLVKG